MASKLMRRNSPYEAEDPLETLLFESFTDLQCQLTPPYQLTLRSPPEYARIMQALLYAILTQEHQGQSHVTHLKAVVTDGYASLVHLLIKLVNESYPRLLDQVKLQVIWIFRQLVELDAADSETLCLCLLRRVAGGDLSPGNAWLALELLHVLQGNWGWVTANPGLLTGALFTYLRLLSDHCRSKLPVFNVLRKNETEFCIRVLRERFQDCIGMGRDLVRLLQDVICIPEVGVVWKGLLTNPGVFRVPGFVDISQLYLTRTPARYLVSRVTPEMETQMRFMLTHVKWGNQRRYQAWFAGKFFAAPESETLIPDLIRFICCGHHPPNEILQSDIISRWAIIGWLLKCCKTKHVEANAKVALFYDWLFFASKTDNIMNIEPAILLMVHSIPKYVDITQSLLELLFFLMENYDSHRRELIHRGVSASFEILIGKGVIRSLEPLLSCNLITPSIREKLATCFVKTHGKIDHGIAERMGKKISEVGTVVNKNAVLYGSQTSGQNTLSSLCQKGNKQSYVTGLRKKDSSEIESDVVATMQRKRIRVDDTVGVVQPKRMDSNCTKKMSINSLLESLKRSNISALDMLEKILLLFLGICEQTVDGPIGRYSLPNFSQDSSPEMTEELALEMANALKAGGHELFSPLMHAPDDLERDEFMSATSVVLRIYTLSPHPKLQKMLFFWHKSGLAVGPRLLCYATRLANELEQVKWMKNASDEYSLKQNLKDKIICLDGVDSMEEESGSTDINKDTMNGRKQRSLEQSLLRWHAERYSLHANSKKASSPCIQPTENVRMRELHIMVKDAFRVYREFLVFTNTSASTSLSVNSNQGKMLPAESLGVCSANYLSLVSQNQSGCSVKHTLNINQNVTAAFLRNLKTLCLWNLSRMQQVFRTIFCYLSDLSTGKESVIQLLVCFLAPAELLRFEIKLGLKDFSIFGDDPQTLCTLLKSSLDWDFSEQQSFWRLLTSELQVCEVPLVMILLKFSVETLDPSVHVAAFSGLLMFLRIQFPSVEIFNAILCLPKRFAKFGASVIASWLVSNCSIHSRCITDWINVCLDNIQTTNNMNNFSPEKLNLDAIRALICFLERHDVNQSVGSKSLKKSEFSEIRASLSKLVDKVCLRE